MGVPIVVVPAGGLPVTLVTNGFGTPMTIATSGFGLPVTVVASGGLPVTGFTAGPAFEPTTLTSSSNATLSNGDLTVTHTTATLGGARSTAYRSSGKYYFEVTIGQRSGNNDAVSIQPSSAAYGGAFTVNGNAACFLNTTQWPGNLAVSGGLSGQNTGPIALGNKLRCAVDFDNKKVWFAVNGGLWNNNPTSDPGTNVGGLVAVFPSGSYAPMVSFDTGAINDTHTFNFGASAFAYTVPTGFTAGWPALDVTVPVITSSNTISQPENAILTHTLTASEAVTWAKVGGADTAKFTLAGSTLTLPAKNYEAPDDADANRSYVVQVQATDLASNVSAIQTITVTITDVDDTAPTITSAATFSTPENASYNHTLTANETVTWSIVGGADAAQFSLAGATLTLAAQDYEAGTSRVVQVRATDTAGNQTTQTITATITNIVEDGEDLLGPIIADAIGVWDATNYQSSTRKVIKNTGPTAGATDQNVLGLPRRSFTVAGYYGGHSDLTVTDNVTAAPDGSMEASSIVSTGTAWFFQKHTTIAAGTYTICLSMRSLSGSSQNVKLGAYFDNSTKTVTTTWQRFSHTAACAAAEDLFLQANGSIANLAICDFEVFLGSSDLNTTALTQKPLCCRTQDLILGSSNSDPNISVAGGVAAPTTMAMLMLPSIATLSAMTVLYVAKKTATPSDADIMSVLAKPSDWTTLSVGPANGGGGVVGIFNGGGNRGHSGSGVYGAGGSSFAHLWAPDGGDYTVEAHTGDAASCASWMQGRKLLQSGTFAPVTGMSSVRVMCTGVGSGSQSGLSWKWCAIWNRKLTDTEIRDASASLLNTFSVPKRVMALVGTSIIAGAANDGMGNNLSPRRTGVNYGVGGDTFAELNSRAAALDTLVTGGPALTEYLLFIDIGTNDLNNGTTPAATLAALQSYIDARRAAGWNKIVGTTVLPRTDAGGLSDAAFASARATYNTSVRALVGTKLDAVADWAANTTIGEDGDSNNATYYVDLVHLTAAGHTILETINRAAINSVP